jgi:hypothetical protein
MFNLGIKAERNYRKPYIPMLKENNDAQREQCKTFGHGEFLAVRNQLPDSLPRVA